MLGPSELDRALGAARDDQLAPLAADVVMLAGPDTRRLTEALQRALRRRQLHGSVAGRQWADALAVLGDMDDPTRLAEIALLGPDALAHLAHGAPAGTLRSELDAALRARPEAVRALVALIEATAREEMGREEIARRDWLGAAREIRGLGAADLNSVLGTYTLDQLSNLRSVTTGPEHRWFNYVAGPLAAAYTARLNRDFDGAVAHHDPLTALRLADLFDEAGMRAALQRATTAGFAGDMAAASSRVYPEEHRVRRTLRYLAHPADFGTAANPPQSLGGTGGTPSTRTPVPGGEVWVTTNDNLVTDTGTYTDGFTVRFRDSVGSGLAPTTGWVQFIAATMESLNAQGERLEFSTGRRGVLGQRGFLYSRPPSDSDAYASYDALTWDLDALNAPRPFYEGPNATSTMGPTMVEMSDRPGDGFRVAAQLFSRSGLAGYNPSADPVTSVRERTYFEEYLVRGQDVLFAVSVVCEDVWNAHPTDALQSIRRTTEIGRGPAAALRRPQWDALRSRARDYAVYPTR